jgi:hypothetical protein
MIDQFLSHFNIAIRSYLDQHHNLPSIVAVALVESLRPAAPKITPAAPFLFSAFSKPSSLS